RPLLPTSPDAHYQRQSRSDLVDGDAERPQLVRQLPRKGDDPAFGGGVRAAAARAEPSSSDRRDVHDLPGALTLHDWRDHVAKEKSPVEVEGEEALPFGEREVVDRGGLLRVYGASAQIVVMY